MVAQIKIFLTHLHNFFSKRLWGLAQQHYSEISNKSGRNNPKNAIDLYTQGHECLQSLLISTGFYYDAVMKLSTLLGIIICRSSILSWHE
jgi:hypothetical protein